MYPIRLLILTVFLTCLPYAFSFSQVTNIEKIKQVESDEKIQNRNKNWLHPELGKRFSIQSGDSIQSIRIPFQYGSENVQNALSWIDFMNRTDSPLGINKTSNISAQTIHPSTLQQFSNQQEIFFAKTYFPDETPTELRLISADGSLVSAMWTRITEGGAVELRVTRSMDKGLTFSPPKTLFVDSGFIFPLQIDVAGNTVILLWLARTEQGGSNLYVTHSSDNGTTFTDPENVSRFPDTSSGTFGSMIVNGSHVTVFWGEDGGYDEIYAASSFDGGLTFDNPIPISNRKGDRVYGPWTAQGPQGELYVAWQADAGINFTKSTNFGRTFSQPETVMPGRCCFRTLHASEETIFLQAARAVRSSHDGGSTWKYLFPGIRTLSSTVATSSTMYIGGTDWDGVNTVYTPKLAVSTNEGLTFQHHKLTELKSNCFWGLGLTAQNNNAAVWWYETDPQTSGCNWMTDLQDFVIQTTNNEGQHLNQAVRFPAKSGSMDSQVFSINNQFAVLWPYISLSDPIAVLNYSFSEDGGKSFSTLKVESGLTSLAIQVFDATQNDEKIHLIAESINGLFIATKSDIDIPPAPTKLLVEPTEAGPILFWDASIHSEIDSYIIYSGDSLQNLHVLDSVSAENNTYDQVPDQSSFFVVTAMNKAGLESPPSNFVSYVNYNLNVSNEWQLVSFPGNKPVTDFQNSQLFNFNRVYQRTNNIEPGIGVWIRSENGEELTVRGVGLLHSKLELNEGWNLVGGLAEQFPVSSISDPDGILSDAPVYYYQAGTYQQASELDPGNGYWLHANKEGVIELQTEDLQLVEKQKQIITDQSKNLYRLYFKSENGAQNFWISRKPLEAEQEIRFMLPPKAPDPCLDVRTDTGYAISQQHTVPIEITSASWPVEVTITSTENSDSDYIYRITATESMDNVHFNLLEGQPIRIPREYDNLILEQVHIDEVIKEYHVSSNYPNPFNPFTTIQYQIPKESHVVIDIFNIVGQRVVVLVNQQQQAGIYTIQFDGSKQASGVYFLRFQSGQFTNIQKLTLIK